MLEINNLSISYGAHLALDGAALLLHRARRWPFWAPMVLANLRF